MWPCCVISQVRVSAYAARPVGIDESDESPWPRRRLGRFAADGVLFDEVLVALGDAAVGGVRRERGGIDVKERMVLTVHQLMDGRGAVHSEWTREQHDHS